MQEYYDSSNNWGINDSTSNYWPPETYYPWYPYTYPYYVPVHLVSCPKCSKLIECTDSYCKHCGHQLKPKTCPNCGKPL